MSASKFDKADRLTGDNYRIWSERIEGSLVLSDLWLDIDKQTEATKEDAEKAKKAYFLICSTCDNVHVDFLRNVARLDSIKALRALRERYEGEGVMPKIEILHNVLQLRFNGSNDIKTHIDDIRTAYQRLTEKGLDIPDIVRVANLMISLPHDYSNVISHLITQKESELSFKRVESAIHNEHRRLTMRSDGISASVSRTFSKPLNHKKDQRKDSRVTCTFCGKIGHGFDACFKRLRKHSFAPKQHQSNNKHVSNSAAEADETESPCNGQHSLHAGEDEETLINKLLNPYEKLFHSTLSNSVFSGWIADSGASVHMAHDVNLFSELNRGKFGKIKIADGSFIPIEGLGKLRILIKTIGKPFALMLHNVAYVPKLHINLLSINELDKSGHAVLFENGTANLKVGNDYIAFAKFINNNYLVIEEQCNSAYPCLHEWHRRLAHRNLRDINNLRKFGMEITKCNCLDQCDACLKGKSTSLPFGDSKKPENPLDLIVSDVAQIETSSLSGCKYFLTIVDACTDYTMVKFLKHKSEVAQQIINFVEFTKKSVVIKTQNIQV